MNDREKQIEELSKKLRAYAYDLRLDDNGDCRRVAEFVVETLNYRKMDEVTLKLDLGDRTPEEIERIAQQFSQAMSTTPITAVSFSDEEIKKQVAKEILQALHPFTTFTEEEYKEISKKFGVEIDE